MAEIIIPEISLRPSLQEIDDHYGKMRELGRELGIPVFEPFIKAQYVDRHGYRETMFHEHCRTPVRNHWVWGVQVSAHVWHTTGTFGAGVLRLKDTGGTTRNFVDICNAPETTAGYSAGENVDSHGVVIGRGSDAEDFESFILSNQIADGDAANEMYYSDTVLSEGWDVGDEYYYSSRERVFDNQSSGSITVTESGMIYYTTSGGFRILTMRDKDAWGAGQAVADGESIAVTYNLRVYF